MDLGAKFWLGVVGVALGAALAVIIFFMVFGWAWYAWGFLGAFGLFSAVALGLAYLSDRRQQKRDRQFAA